MIEPLFKPPYFAVIFTAVRTDADPEGYDKTAKEMHHMALQMPGCLGVESTRDPANGLGITVSYWRSEAEILDWKNHADHIAARKLGRERWYSGYALRVAEVTREYDFKVPKPE